MGRLVEKLMKECNILISLKCQYVYTYTQHVHSRVETPQFNMSEKLMKGWGI